CRNTGQSGTASFDSRLAPERLLSPRWSDPGPVSTRVPLDGETGRRVAVERTEAKASGVRTPARARAPRSRHGGRDMRAWTNRTPRSDHHAAQVAFAPRRDDDVNTDQSDDRRPGPDQDPDWYLDLEEQRARGRGLSIW